MAFIAGLVIHIKTVLYRWHRESNSKYTVLGKFLLAFTVTNAIQRTYLKTNGRFQYIRNPRGIQRQLFA